MDTITTITTHKDKFRINAVNVICAIIIICCVLLIMVGTRETFQQVEAVGEYYNVLTSYIDTSDAARLMDLTNNRVLQFLEYLKYEYNINDTAAIRTSSALTTGGSTKGLTPVNDSQNANDVIKRVLVNYNPESFFETEPTGKNGTSYTVEKGEQLYMCLREKDTGKLHDINDIMFVAVHELAHMGNATWGHGSEFWDVFRFLLKEAAAAGILEPVDYSKTPMVYCGLSVNYNPLYDNA